MLLLGVGREEKLRNPQKGCAREIQGWRQQIKCCKRGFNFRVAVWGQKWKELGNNHLRGHQLWDGNYCCSWAFQTPGPMGKEEESTMASVIGHFLSNTVVKWLLLLNLQPREDEK